MTEELPNYVLLGDPLADGDVVFVVGAGYHLLDAVRTASELRNLGIGSSIVSIEPPSGPFARHRVSYKRVVETFSAAEDLGQAPGETIPVQKVIACASCIVVRNDWGYDRPLVVAARDAAVPSVGWVEGVQDFHDVDTQMQRRPYCTVDHVFSLGDYDKAELAAIGANDIRSVGSERAWDLWRTELGPPAYRAMINVNFTYGVLTNARSRWVRATLRACKAATITPVLSRHPADRGLVGRSFQSSEPSASLLETSSHLVSRFSTLLYDALLLGVTTIYFNPHGESVSNFDDSGDALKQARSTDELADFLTHIPPSRATVRLGARDFLNHHLTLDGDRPALRAATSIRELRRYR